MSHAIEEQYKMLLEDKQALKAVRAKFNIEESRFIKGLEYVGLTLDGTMSKTKAYATAFKVEGSEAAKISAQFHRSKWIQELIMYLRPADDSLYLSEIKRIIGVNMSIINDNTSTAREKIDATKALQPFIKAEKKMLDLTEAQADSLGSSIVSKINTGIKALAAAGKMVNENGEIIDVELIE